MQAVLIVTTEHNRTNHLIFYQETISNKHLKVIYVDNFIFNNKNSGTPKEVLKTQKT